VVSDKHDEEATGYKSTWSGLLGQFRQKPGMYLGSANLQALRMVLSGFEIAEMIYAVPESRRQEVNDFPWSDFESYVTERQNERRLTLRSFSLAQYEAQGKDLHSFDSSKEYPGAWEIWWKWYDDFADAVRDANQRK
jgi:hypothetical protein